MGGPEWDKDRVAKQQKAAEARDKARAFLAAKRLDPLARERTTTDAELRKQEVAKSTEAKNRDNTREFLMARKAAKKASEPAEEAKAAPAPKKKTDDWVEVKDASGGCYFWDRATDRTTWERPKEMQEEAAGGVESPKEQQQEDEHKEETPAVRFSLLGKVSGGSESRKRPSGHAEGGASGKKRGKKRESAIDPMDPTGSSEGRWSDGMNGDGKMADSTASGPLWQQRPLPSPGDILRKRNA